MITMQLYKLTRQPSQVNVQEVAILYQEYGHLLRDCDWKRERLPLSEMRVLPQVFQPRDMDSWKKDDHIKALAQALKIEGQLDPIVVFPVAGERIVIDGHCRLEAYRSAGYDQTDMILVEHFEGSFSEALMASAHLNSKDKLSLTLEEKLEAAWKLVKHDEDRGNWSLRDIQRASGIGKSTVANMRKMLTEPQLGFDPREHTWADVKRLRNGEKEISDDWKERMTRKWANDLRKRYAAKPESHKDLFLDALRLAYPKVIEQLEDEIRTEIEDELAVE